jgi:hypothetical protein
MILYIYMYSLCMYKLYYMYYLKTIKYLQMDYIIILHSWKKVQIIWLDKLF